jgi:hypothetical protein
VCGFLDDLEWLVAHEVQVLHHLDQLRHPRRVPDA